MHGFYHPLYNVIQDLGTYRLRYCLFFPKSISIVQFIITKLLLIEAFSLKNHHIAVVPK